MPEIGDIVRASDLEANKPQLRIGTVTTGEAGTNASASINGTSPNFILDMTIPRGNNGEKGEQGEQGASGVFTGPLMPTSAYWRNASTRQAGVGTMSITPSGGTWAVICFINDIIYTSILSGGSNIPSMGNIYTTGNYYNQILCWRIQ